MLPTSKFQRAGWSDAYFFTTIQFSQPLREENASARVRAIERRLNRELYGSNPKGLRIGSVPFYERLSDGALHVHILMHAPAPPPSVNAWRASVERITFNIPENWNPQNPADLARYGGRVWNMYVGEWLCGKASRGRYKKANPPRLTTLRAFMLSENVTAWGRSKDWDGSKLLFGTVWVEEIITSEEWERAMLYAAKLSRLM